MPKITWLNLPPNFVSISLTAPKNATSPWKTSSAQKRKGARVHAAIQKRTREIVAARPRTVLREFIRDGAFTRLTFQRALGTRTSARSSFAEKAGYPKTFLLKGQPAHGQEVE
jgi:hypothetical protein